MFFEAESFSGDLSKWDVSKVNNMEEVFYHAYRFNSDLSSWDTSRVTNMRYMFYEAPRFNSDISSWDVSKVENFKQMFYGATSFNQDISKWDLSSGKIWFHVLMPFQPLIPAPLILPRQRYIRLLKAENVKGMFYGATSFNQNLCAWMDQGFPYGAEKSTYIFRNSGCRYSDRPRWSSKYGGPFCKSDCRELWWLKWIFLWIYFCCFVFVSKEVICSDIETPCHTIIIWRTRDLSFEVRS